jgi:hypothetical protein
MAAPKKTISYNKAELLTRRNLSKNTTSSKMNANEIEMKNKVSQELRNSNDKRQYIRNLLKPSSCEMKQDAFFSSMIETETNERITTIMIEEDVIQALLRGILKKVKRSTKNCDKNQMYATVYSKVFQSLFMSDIGIQMDDVLNESISKNNCMKMFWEIVLNSNTMIKYNLLYCIRCFKFDLFNQDMVNAFIHCLELAKDTCFKEVTSYPSLYYYVVPTNKKKDSALGELYSHKRMENLYLMTLEVLRFVLITNLSKCHILLKNKSLISVLIYHIGKQPHISKRSLSKNQHAAICLAMLLNNNNSLDRDSWLEYLNSNIFEYAGQLLQLANCWSSRNKHIFMALRMDEHYKTMKKTPKRELVNSLSVDVFQIDSALFISLYYLSIHPKLAKEMLRVDGTQWIVDRSKEILFETSEEDVLLRTVTNVFTKFNPEHLKVRACLTEFWDSSKAIYIGPELYLSSAGILLNLKHHNLLKLDFKTIDKATNTIISIVTLFKEKTVDLVRGRHYVSAREIYTLCLEMLHPVKLQNVTNKTVNELLVLLWSNRSEMHLQMSRYQEALDDATNALQIDTQHEKSIRRKERALNSLNGTL